MARTCSDERFMLSASIDASTKKMLARAVKAQKPIRTASPAPSAAPVRNVPAQRSIKYLWAKRTSMGFAFAALLAFLWMNFNGKDQQITQVPVPNINKAPVPEQQIAPVTPQVTPAPVGELAVSSSEQMHSTSAPSIPVRKNVEPVKHSQTNDLATNTTSQNEAPQATTAAQQKEDPADVMMSHRYAKMIKATRMVEVTDQDKM